MEGFACRLFGLGAIGGDDRIDGRRDRAFIGDLFQAAGFDDRAGVSVLVLVDEDRQHILGDLARDRRPR